MNIEDMFAEHEAQLLAEGRAAIAAERAEWDALAPEQQAAQTAAIEAKYGDALEISEPLECDVCGGDLDEDGCRHCDGDKEFD